MAETTDQQHDETPGTAATANPTVDQCAQDAPPAVPAVPAVSFGQPAAPRVNPFGGDNQPQLPDCFNSIAHQLPPVIRAKLRTVDLSIAEVVISTAAGKKSEPLPLTWFIEDFAEEAAQAIGRYGLLRVTVLEPNKPKWYFGIKVEAPEGEDAGNGREDWRDAMTRMMEMQQRFMENVKMELMLASGRAPQAESSDAAFDREMARMERYMGLFQRANSANDPGALIERTMDGVGKVFDGVSKIRDKAGEFAMGQQAEPDAVDQFNKITENPLVQMGAQKLFSGALKSRSEETVKGEAAPPKVNPFKTGAA